MKSMLKASNSPLLIGAVFSPEVHDYADGHPIGSNSPLLIGAVFSPDEKSHYSYWPVSVTVPF